MPGASLTILTPQGRCAVLSYNKFAYPQGTVHCCHAIGGSLVDVNLAESEEGGQHFRSLALLGVLLVQDGKQQVSGV